MGEISKTINEILKADEELSKKVENAKLEAKKMIDSARLEVENYKSLKSREVENLKLSLAKALESEVEKYRSEVESKARAISASILEISKSKLRDAVETVSSNVFKEIVGALLSK
ncbi:MAG: V-type ATPase subunit subunit G family protein [Brevinematia bacterium]